jgi:hypothetical protein
MKINFSNLFYFFSSINLLASQLSKVTSLSDNIFENASNKSMILKKEYSNAAFCEYDVCHEVLQPTQKQWVAYSKDTGSETLTYDICDTAGPGSIIYQLGKPECVSYSGAMINITSTTNNVTASGNEYVQNIHVNKVKENQTDSDACLEVYDVHFSLVDLDTVPTFSPTSLPQLNSNNTTELSTDNNALNSKQLILAMVLFTVTAASLSLLLSKNKCLSNKKESLLGNENLGNTYGGLFSHLSFKRKEIPAQQREATIHSFV